MKIRLTSVFVSDQQKALDFYTETLGFEMKHDIPLGEYRWLTVVSPEDENGAELLLEPDAHDAARAYQGAIFGDGIPAAHPLHPGCDCRGGGARVRRREEAGPEHCCRGDASDHLPSAQSARRVPA